MNTLAGDILLTAGNKWYQKVIRWRTNSQWNHAAIIVDDDGGIIEATFPKVRRRTIIDYINDGSQILLLRSVTPFDARKLDEALIWLSEQVGHQYDWRGILSFVFNKQCGNRSYYFCSELVYEFYQRVGIQITRENIPELFSPEDIADSIAFEEVPI